MSHLPYLLVRARHKPSLNSRGGGVDSASLWEELQNAVKRPRGREVIIEAIFCKQCISNNNNSHYYYFVGLSIGLQSLLPFLHGRENQAKM